MVGRVLLRPSPPTIQHIYTYQIKKSVQPTGYDAIICPSCKQNYDVESSVIGQKVRCAVCNQTFIAQMNEPITLQLKDESNIQAKKPINNQAKKTIPQHRKNNNELNVWSIIVIAILVALAWGSLTGKGCSSAPSSSNHVETNSQYHMTSGAVGFRSKDSLEKYYQYYQQNDDSARMSCLNSHMATGDAVMFYGGETVTVSDISSWSGMAKVRRTGSYSEYWTYSVWLE